MITRAGISLVEGTERRFILSFSSETPVPVGQKYIEILDHSPEAVDLTRLNEMGCLLLNHDVDKVLGKVLRAWVEDGKGYAEVEFDTDEQSELIYGKVKNKTLKGVSVRCRVDKWEELRANKRSLCGRFLGPASIARKWVPLEISIVTIPADSTVGVGRKYDEEESFMDVEKTAKEINQNEPEAKTTIEKDEEGLNSTKIARMVNETWQIEGEAPQQNQARKPAEPTVNTVEEVERAIKEERTRMAEIGALCSEFGIDGKDFIERGVSIEEVQRKVLESIKDARKPASLAVLIDEEDKFRAAASDGLILRSGFDLESKAQGADEFRAISLRDLAVECLAREGVIKPYLMDGETLMRQFFNPTSAFPSIMDMTIEKAYTKGYSTVNVTFDKWTTKGTLKDFKESRGNYYIAGPAGEFLLVPESGELKADIPEDTLLPKRKLDTYGRQFTMTRQAFINDDIGFLTTLPSRYAASAKRTIRICGIISCSFVGAYRGNRRYVTAI